MEIKVFIFYILLIDSIVANVTAWFGERWYAKHFRAVSCYFPMRRGWTLAYLILVLWIGRLVGAY